MAGEVIRLIENEKAPRSVCPHCKKVMFVDVTMFKDDVTKIMESKCPYCHGTIYTGVLILSNTDLRKLAGAIQTVIDALKPANKIIG